MLAYALLLGFLVYAAIVLTVSAVIDIIDHKILKKLAAKKRG